MAQQYYTVATNKGLELINAHVLDGNKPFMADNWYIALGDGNLTPSKDTTQLVHKIFDKNSEGYQGFTVTTDKEWGRMAKITLPDVLKGQVIREIGLFNENDELMLVANTYINLSEMSDNDGLSSILQPAISLKAIPDNVLILNVPEGDYVTHEVYDPKMENVDNLLNALTAKFANYRPIEIGAPIPTLSDNLPDNAIWLEGAKVAKVDYPTLHNVYGDKYYITNFEDVGLISSGVQFEYNGKLTNYSSRNFIQTAEKFITNGRPWCIRFRHKTPSAFSAVYSLLGNATGANFKQAIEFDVMTTGLLRLCISSNGTSYNIVNAKTGANKLLVDTWYDIILKFTGSAYIVTFKQVVEDAEVNNEGEWTTDLNIASEVAIYENAEDDNLLCLGNHVYTASAQLPCLGVIDFTKSHILTTSENATENFDEVFWKWTKKRDEDVDYFKLPDARNRVLWGTTESNFGYSLPKLPNITGGFGANGSGWGSSIANWFGAFYANNLGGSSWFAADSHGACSGATLDASRSSNIYQDVQTVQPPSLNYRVYTYYA